MSAMFDDIRHALRLVRRSPAVAASVVGTLTLLIGASAAFFSVWNAVARRPLPVREPHRLVDLSLADRQGAGYWSFNYDAYLRLSGEQQALDGVFGYTGGGIFAVEGRSTFVDATIAATSHEFFSTLALTAELGRLIEPADAPVSGEPAPVVVIGHRLWRRLFNQDPRVIGERLAVRGIPLTIVGVLDAGFVGFEPDFGTDFYVSLPMLHRLLGSQGPPRPNVSHIVGRLRPGMTLAQARSAITSAWPEVQLATFPPSLTAAEREERRALVLSVRSASGGFSSLRERLQRPLAMLTALALVLLAAGCVSVGGLFHAKAVERGRMFATMAALGATRARLLRTVAFESLLLSSAGVLFGFPLAWAASAVIGPRLSLGSFPLALDTTPDVGVMVAVGIGLTLMTLAISWLPAVAVGRVKVHAALGARGTATAAPSRWTAIPVATVVALSIVLLVSASLFAATLQRLRSLDSGFRTDGLLFTRAWQLPGPRQVYDEQSHNVVLVERLSALPGVRSVALSQYFPGYLNFTGIAPERVGRLDADRTAEVEALSEYVSPRFFETVGATIRRGRDFAWSDRVGSPTVVVINEALERSLFPGGGALGSRIRIGTAAASQSLEVIGVSSDVTVGNLRSPHMPVAFRARMQEARYLRVPIVLLRVDDAASPASLVGPAIRSLGREYIRQIDTIQGMMNIAVHQERLVSAASSLFAALSALLACVGLYALVAFGVVRRTREIGLRMALGSSPVGVVRLVVREAVLATVAGIVVGVPGGVAVGRLAESLLFGVTPTDPWVMAAPSIGFVLVATTAAWLPASRAARIDPTVALRSD